VSMRTARGPVVVVFYSGGWSEEDVAYFKDWPRRRRRSHGRRLSGRHRVRRADRARDFVRETGMKSYVLYDYSG
jgi:hypothetical protein